MNNTIRLKPLCLGSPVFLSFMKLLTFHIDSTLINLTRLMIVYFSFSASPFMKYTLPRNSAGVSENLQLEIWCQLDKCFFFFPHQTPFPLQIGYSVHSFNKYLKVPPTYTKPCAEQDTMSLSPRTDILAGKTDTVNYTVNVFILIKQFRIL